MNVLILGGGGREHALAWSISKSASCHRLQVAPGNAGTGRIGENVALDAAGGRDVLSFCRREDVDLVVVGPEAPLVAGVSDALRAEGVPVFGVGAEGARLEGSKVHAKEMMLAAGVPTARSATIRTVEEAEVALDSLGERVAVKADGLAAGKGVVMAGTREEAIEAVRAAVIDRAFGEAGVTVVLEEWLEGDEVSVLALVDGREVRPLTPSQDHKRALDGDRGLNTGGMGAYAPYAGFTGDALADAVETCIVPVVDRLARQGADYRGVIYAGLMRTADGPKVLEYNVRFGDPETQVVLPLFAGDILEAFAACARGELAQAPAFERRPGAALTVVAASAGYPVSSDSGRVIEGLGEDDDRGEAIVFHAGTAVGPDGQIVTAGGRVLAVTGLGSTLAEARDAAYGTLGSIRYEGMFHRTDIGARGLAALCAAGEEPS